MENREPKYRAFYKPKKKGKKWEEASVGMHEVVGILTEEWMNDWLSKQLQINIKKENGGHLMCVPEELELMQFTGLKDKNGIGIYEGDIVMQKVYKDKGEIGIVKFGKYKKSSEDEWTGNIGFYIDWNNKATRVDLGYWTDGYKDVYLEVIGNIYENKNLLIDTKL